MSDFAAGFFGSLYGQAQAQQQAKADEKRMRMLKNLDLEYQRNSSVEERDGKIVRVVRDGLGNEIPALTKELNQAEAKEYAAKLARSEADLVESEDIKQNYSLDKAAARSRAARQDELMEARELRAQESHRSSLANSAKNRQYQDWVMTRPERGAAGQLDPTKMDPDTFNKAAAVKLVRDMSKDVNAAIKASGGKLTQIDIEQAALNAVANAKDEFDAKKRLNMYLKSILLDPANTEDSL